MTPGARSERRWRPRGKEDGVNPVSPVVHHRGADPPLEVRIEGRWWAMIIPNPPHRPSNSYTAVTNV
jgi:hypothetical protein